MSDIKLKPCPRCGKDQHVYGITKSPGGGFQVECHHCGFVVPTEGNLIEVINAWNNYPRLPKWTTETPTEPGWYWNRYGAWPPEIVRLYYDSDNEFCYTVNGVGDCCWLVEELASEPGCAWAGPIPEPQEQP